MAEPPLFGAVHVTVNWLVEVGVTVGAATASGAPISVDAEDADQRLSPWVFVARTCATYDVLLVRFVMVYERAVFAAEFISRVVHVAPLSAE